METSNIKDRIAKLASEYELARSNATSELINNSRLRITALEQFIRGPDMFPYSQSTLRIQTSAHTACRPLCACVCHKESRLQTPRWMDSIMGSLLLGYSGVPTISYLSTKCTETLCHRNQSPLINAQYCFPSWFLRRAIIIRSRNSPLYGNQLSMRTPRVVGDWSEYFFY